MPVFLKLQTFLYVLYGGVLVGILQERVRVEAAKVGAAVAGRLEERARREENCRREVRDCTCLLVRT